MKLVEPPTQDTAGGVIKFELWEHLRQAVNILLNDKLITWLKARQVGASWLISAYDLWRAMSGVGTNVMIFSKGETEAFEKLKKCHHIYTLLPEFLKLELKPDSAGEMGFPTMLSSIKAFPATQTAGISFTASVLDIDEWAEHPYAEENYLRAKPTVDSAGGQLIGVFTPNPWELDCLAHALFQDAMAGKNNFTYLFTPYSARPGRDKEWYDRTKMDTPEQALQGLSRELYMEKCFPASIEEALRPSQTASAFDHKVLDEMMGDVKNSIELKREGIDPLIVHIYQDYHIGEYFIAATDTSHGLGQDFSVTTIMNVRTGAIVADIMDNLLSPEELALHSVGLLGIYHNPLWYIESNDYGGVTIATAQNLGYKNFGYQDDKKTKIGFNTTGYKTTTGLKGSRADLFGGLIPAINNHQITIFNSHGIKQFYDIIRNSEKNGRIEAVGGRHDDYPITVGICWAKKGEVQTEPLSLEPVETLHFKPSDHSALVKRWIGGLNEKG